MTDAGTTRGFPRSVAVAIGVLIAIVLAFAAIRVVSDWPHILAGTETDNDFAKRYIAHPWLAYVHIVPGVVYLLGAPFQLSASFRTRHYTLHRRLGRFLLACALTSGVFALLFGLQHSFGGTTEAVATVVFGSWFIACLVTAFVAIRSDDVRRHRRWMIRAFAVGIGIGTIRIWVGLFIGLRQLSTGGAVDPMPEPTGFGIAFWLAFVMHVALGEWWLRRTPDRDS